MLVDLVGSDLVETEGSVGKQMEAFVIQESDVSSATHLALVLMDQVDSHQPFLSRLHHSCL